MTAAGPFAVHAPLTRLRSQVAVVRSLADQVDFLSDQEVAAALRAQVIEELERLGLLLLAEARSMAGTTGGSSPK